MKSRLLRVLLAPFFLFVDDPDTAAAVEDRGDTLPGDTTQAEAADAAAKADADAEIARIAEEKATADAAKAEEEAAKPVKKDSRIPLSRHEDILAKERARTEALEAELSKLRTGKQAVDVNEHLTATEEKIVAMEAEYMALMEKGEPKPAQAKMAEIRRLERSISETKAEVMMQQAVAQATAQIQFDTTVDKLEAAYPVLNPKHEDYDPGKINEVLELQQAYKVMGHTPAAALQKAVGMLMRPATAKQEAATKEVDPAPAEADAAAKIAAARKQAATEKGIDAANKTPANTSKIGIDSDKVGGGLAANVMNLSQAEFAKLGEKELAALRGDLL